MLKAKTDRTALEAANENCADVEAALAEARQAAQDATDAWLGNRTDETAAARARAEEEVQFHELRLTRARRCLEEEERAARERATIDFHAKLEATAREAADQVTAIGVLDEQIIDLFELKLAGLLAKREALCEGLHAAVAHVLAESEPNVEHAGNSITGLDSVTRGRFSVGHVVDAAYAAGFGHRGLHLAPFIQYMPIRVDTRLHDDVSAARKRLERELREALDRRAQRIGIAEAA